jgi:hypothetical protein
MQSNNTKPGKWSWLLFLLTITVFPLKAVEWQWYVPVRKVISSETNENPKAFLWIPSNCKQVKAIVVGQQNMLEEPIFEHPVFRKTMSELGFAIIWISPMMDLTFDFHQGAGEIFNETLADLANVSGYKELAYTPIVPIGHSAQASYPWNFAAWNPERTLAVLSIHGDAPLTNLTGSGRPNPDWENRTIEGVPGLMVEGEYEWWEDRVQPALNYRSKYPKAPVSFLADAGHGHFDCSDEMVDYLCLFLRKAVKYRMPAKFSVDKPVKLNPVDPSKGWLADRFRPNQFPKASAAPYNKYKGDLKDAFWYFDKETAGATEKFYARQRGKKEQYLGFTQNGKLLTFNPKLHARITGKFEPEPDGLTFHVGAVFTDTLRSKESNEHAAGKPVINRICGPAVKVNDTTFTIRFYNMGLNNKRRTSDIWLMASHNGDGQYKSTVQQFMMHFPYPVAEGQEQKITFDSIPDVKCGIASIKLNAKSDSGMPVYFYVQQGPAEVIGNTLHFKQLPPRAKYPVKVVIVAWQYGRSVEPKVKTATPVVRSFNIFR